LNKVLCQEVKTSELTEENKVFYYKSKPFTGKAVDYYPNGQKRG
jgi:hypothetical protein